MTPKKNEPKPERAIDTVPVQGRTEAMVEALGDKPVAKDGKG